jgi:hypothetical protein
MRLNESHVIIGRRGTGKSTYANQLAEFVAKKTGKKTLIIDVNGAPAYAHHQELTVGNFKTWCDGNYNGVKRFYLSDNQLMMEMVAENFRNGFVFFEDCTKYIEANPKKIVKDFLVDLRMWNVDLFFTFHSLEFVPPFFWKMCNKVHVLRTDDILDKRDNFFLKRIPNYMAIKRAMLQIRKSKAAFPNPKVIGTNL